MQILCHIAHNNTYFQIVIWIKIVLSLTSVTVDCPAISTPSPKYNSTDFKSSIPRDYNSNHLVSVPSVTMKWPATSRTSSEYNCIDLKSPLLGDLNSDCVDSLPQCLHYVTCHFKMSPEYDPLDLKSSVSWTVLNNDCTGSLPHCHQEAVISWQSSKYNSTDTKRSVSHIK